LRLELKKFQLLYANKSKLQFFVFRSLKLFSIDLDENWQTARQEENTRLHLIKPITLYTNFFKCIYSNNINFPTYVLFEIIYLFFNFNNFSWKISGQISDINMRISDAGLFKIIKHIQSFSFSQSKYSSITTTEMQTELWTVTPLTDTQETFETIETLVKENKPDEFEEQFTQIEANFEISKVIINNI